MILSYKLFPQRAAFTSLNEAIYFYCFKQPPREPAKEDERIDFQEASEKISL